MNTVNKTTEKLTNEQEIEIVKRLAVSNYRKIQQETGLGRYQLLALRNKHKTYYDGVHIPKHLTEPDAATMIARMGRYKTKFGHVEVPKKTKKYKRLRDWLDNQLARFQNGTLAADIAQGLTELGVVLLPQATLQQDQTTTTQDQTTTENVPKPEPTPVQTSV